MFDVEKKLDVRHCPRCTFPLEALEHDGVELDHCHRCGGTFLDPHEEAAKLGPFASPSTWKDSEITTPKGSGELNCPHDHVVMDAYEVAFDGDKVVVDVCPQCAGLWLDANEGILLRQIVMTAGQDFNTGINEKPSGGATVRDYVFQFISRFPMEVWNPIHKTPWFTISTIALLFAIFLFQLSDKSWGLQFAVLPENILQGKHLLSLLTSSFLHGSWLHLLGNIYFLYVFGDNVEDTLGAWRFVFIYVVAAVAGSLLQAFTQPDPTIYSLGASDAVAGMMGAYFVLFPRVKLYIMIIVFRVRIPAFWFLGFWIAWNLFQGLFPSEDSLSVAWMAHVGGFAAGALLGYVFKPKAFVEHFAKHSV